MPCNGLLGLQGEWLRAQPAVRQKICALASAGMAIALVNTGLFFWCRGHAAGIWLGAGPTWDGTLVEGMGAMRAGDRNGLYCRSPAFAVLAGRYAACP